MKTRKEVPNPTSKNTNKNNSNDQQLLSDIANFASSIGLNSSSSFSGFNDVDFRKKGTIKTESKKDSNPTPKSGSKTSLADKNPPKPGKGQSFIKNEKVPKSNPKRKHSPLPSLNDFGDNKGKFDKFKNLPVLPLVKASGLAVWYEDAVELEKKALGGEEEKRKKLFESMKMGVEEWKGVVEEKRELGERLMRQYVQDFDRSKGQSGAIKMAVASQRSGSAADKVSAFYVLVDENPIANLRSLDALLGMVTSKVGKRHALKAFEVLREIFVSSLLPDRKLKSLLQQPVNNLPETKDGYSLLLFWYFEDCLKQRYERFVSALEEASRDILPALKDKALKTMYVLLKSKQEQERCLLSALVNKLGDPQNKGASNADFHLSNLLSEHPKWKAVVIDEVDSFLFRPKLGPRAKYHAVNFLSQIRLSHHGDGPKVAKHLIDLYFAVFKVLITDANSKQKSSTREDNNTRAPSKEAQVSPSDSHVEMDSRILSALLTGVNRAFPYVANTEADDVIEVQTPMLFKLVHSKNFNVGVQALMLLDKISSKNQIVSDRFYRALYSKLLLPAAMNTSKAEMFIGLLLRAMKNDVNLKRVAAFSKRLLQVALQQPPQYACGCLFLLSEVLKARPPLWNTVLQNESIDEELEHFEDIMEDDSNGPNAALKKEENNQPVKMSKKDKSEINCSDDEDDNEDEGDDDEENEEDDESPTSSSEDDVSEEEELIIEDSSGKIKRAHQQSGDNGNQPGKSFTRSNLPGGYDPRHREPSYCNADHASWWELQVLASHAHPSVATMAGTLLSGANVVYDGNPLNDLSLTAFLDKFMEKKPKQTTWHGGSQIEPAKKLEMNHHLIGPEILSLAELDVPPEDLVFHKFYMNKLNTTKPKKKKKKKKGAEDVAAEEFFGVDDDDEVDEVDGGDESDNEEIENLLDAADNEADPDEYDSDDLDNVGEEDDDLVGNASDVPSDVEDGEDNGAIISDVKDDDDDGEDINIGDEDDDDGNDDKEEARLNKQKLKRKSRGKSGASPFANLEDYEHLLNDDDGGDGDLASEKKSKRRKRHSKHRR